MGAQIAEATIKAMDINKAWRIAYDEAEEYSGSQDGYSGDLNTCSFTRDLTSKLKDMSEAKLQLYMQDNCPKREAWGYCRTKPKQNTNKVKTVVDNIPQKGTRKWETVYNGVNWDGDVKVSASSQTECIKKARAWVEKNPNITLDIEIAKKLSGSRVCAKVSYKSSKTESIGVYKFIGLAGC
jgi:hypothetical protein